MLFTSLPNHPLPFTIHILQLESCYVTQLIKRDHCINHFLNLLPVYLPQYHHQHRHCHSQSSHPDPDSSSVSLLESILMLVDEECRLHLQKALPCSAFFWTILLLQLSWQSWQAGRHQAVKKKSGLHGFLSCLLSWKAPDKKLQLFEFPRYLMQTRQIFCKLNQSFQFIHIVTLVPNISWVWVLRQWKLWIKSRCASISQKYLTNLSFKLEDQLMLEF